MKIKNLVIIAFLSAILFASKEVLAFLPNVEIVTLLLMIISILFPFRIAISVPIIFSFLQILIYGINDWFFGYLIVFPLIVIISTLVAKKTKSEYIFAMIALFYGLLFDVPFAIIKGIMFGVNFMVTYFMAGILFDIIHGVSNFIIVIVLLKPLLNFLSKSKIFKYTK